MAIQLGCQTYTWQMSGVALPALTLVEDGLDPDCLGYTPDSGHIAKGGMDPLAIIRKYRSQVVHVHFKDMNTAGRWEPMGAGSIDHEGTTRYLAEMREPISEWSGHAYQTAFTVLQEDIKALQDSGTLDRETAEFAKRLMRGRVDLAEASKKSRRKRSAPVTNMSAPVAAAYSRGREVYSRDAHCTTCHGEDGLGAVAGVYPPLANSEWVDDELLLKIILKGLWGKIDVNGKTYDPAAGIPPMTAFEHMLTDQEIADVATFTRIAFRDRKVVTGLITPEQVRDLRASLKDKSGFYTPEELLQDHPLDLK